MHITVCLLDSWSQQKPLCGLIANSEKASMWEITFLFIHSNNCQKELGLLKILGSQLFLSFQSDFIHCCEEIFPVDNSDFHYLNLSDEGENCPEFQVPEEQRHLLIKSHAFHVLPPMGFTVAWWGGFVIILNLKIRELNLEEVESYTLSVSKRWSWDWSPGLSDL